MADQEHDSLSRTFSEGVHLWIKKEAGRRWRGYCKHKLRQC